MFLLLLFLVVIVLEVGDWLELECDVHIVNLEQHLHLLLELELAHVLDGHLLDRLGGLVREIAVGLLDHLVVLEVDGTNLRLGLLGVCHWITPPLLVVSMRDTHPLCCRYLPTGSLQCP